MSDRPRLDPYQRRPEYSRDPPRGFVDTCRMIGPGLILAGGLVGSGELVATTVLGAENGYRLLWLILVSCTIKTVVQNELGRYAIGTGETTLEAFDRVPGPRWRVSWVVWLWCLAVLFSLFGLGGMLGGIGEVLNRIVPSVAIGSWVWIVNFVTVALLLIGRYAVVEKVSVALVLTFTALTVSCAALLMKRPDLFSWASVGDGLSLRLPEAGFVTAVTVFGVTGVSAMSLVIYPYWCLEKGIRAVHRHLRQQRPVAASRPWLDPRDGGGRGHRDGRLHGGDGRLLRLGSRHSQGYGDCPGRRSNGAIAGQRLHRDSG